MTSQESPHLDPEALLLYCDRELGEPARAEAERHVAGCAECRGRIDELDSGLRLYRIVQPAPAPWSDLQAGMAAIDASRRVERRPARSRWWLTWGAAAAALLAVVAGYVRYRELPSVQAAELLRKAVAAAPVAPAGSRIRIHTSKRDFVRPAVLSGNAAAEPEVTTLFADAGYDWKSPLTASSFAEWRNHLGDREDQVQVEASVYLVRTSSATNELMRATLVLRARDLVPIRETMEFRRETIEISSVAGDAERALEAPTPGRNGGIPAQVVRLSPAVRQLRALAALHTIGADLGELELHANGAELAIQGAGIGEDRREEIRRAVAGIEGVALTFDNAASQTGATPSGRIAGALKPGPEAPLRSLLMSKLKAGESVDDAVDRILDASDAVLAQSVALRSLAARFPANEEVQLAEADRAALAHLRDDYARRVAEKLDGLAIVLRPVAVSHVTAASSTGGSWREAAEGIFAAVKSLDAVLSTSFAGAAQAGVPLAELQHSLESALGRARMAVAAGGRP